MAGSGAPGHRERGCAALARRGAVGRSGNEDSAREGTAFGAMLVRACRARGGFEPEIRHRTNDLRLLSEIVARGLAVGLVPSLGLAWVVTGVVVRPPAGAPLDRRIFTAVRRGTTARPAIRALEGALSARAAELGVAA